MNVIEYWSTNSRTTIPQSLALTITPRGHPPIRVLLCIKIHHYQAYRQQGFSSFCFTIHLSRPLHLVNALDGIQGPNSFCLSAKLACPCVRVQQWTSRMSSSLLPRQWPASLVHLFWIVFKMGNEWPYNCCFVGCCFQYLFKTAWRILMLFLYSFIVKHLVKVKILQSYNSTDS